MRVVLDTNILVSALLVQTGFPAAILPRVERKAIHAPDVRRTTRRVADTLRKPRIAARIKPYKAGRLVNDLRAFAEIVDTLPKVRRSPDPTDDFLLALCEGGKAEYLVTGDTSGLLALGRHRTTRIVSARVFAGRIMG
jgi:uncharacterized protein